MTKTIEKTRSTPAVLENSLGDEFLNKTRSFATLGYSPERIAQMLALPSRQKQILLLRIAIPGDVYNTAYYKGKADGEYNIDAELAKKAEKGEIDAITLLQERKELRNELDLRKELFGF